MHSNDHDHRGEWRDGPTTIDGTIFGDQPPSETTMVRIEQVRPNRKGLSSIDLRAYCGLCCGTTHTHLAGKEVFRSLLETVPQYDHRGDFVFLNCSTDPVFPLEKLVEGFISCSSCNNIIQYSIARHEMQPQSIIGGILLAHVDQLRALRYKKDAPRRAWQSAKAYARELLQPHIQTEVQWDDLARVRLAIDKRIDHLAHRIDTRDEQRAEAMWQISTALNEVKDTLDAFVKTQTTEPEKVPSVADSPEETGTKEPQRYKRPKSKARTSSPARRHRHERKD